MKLTQLGFVYFLWRLTYDLGRCAQHQDAKGQGRSFGGKAARLFFIYHLKAKHPTEANSSPHQTVLEDHGTYGGKKTKPKSEKITKLNYLYVVLKIQQESVDLLAKSL